MLEKLIGSIDAWMQASQSNYALYFVILALFLALGLVVSWLFYKKIGKSDERSDFIKLRIGYITLGAGWALTLIFVSSLVDASVTYASQLVLIPLVLTILVGAATSAIYYNRNK
jgi:predicted Na+-dependent transporter